MQLSKITLLGSMLFASSLAAPTAVIPESVVNATAAGIDIFGPIPDDYKSFENGLYLADVGSKAWTWIRAQIDADFSSQSVEKRQSYANIGIGMFAQDLCNGQAGWFDDVIYGNNNYVTVNMYSVGISYRGLRNGEQLDFSRLRGNDWCGNYRYSAAPNTPVGCFNSQLINCFRLTTN